MRSCVLYVRSLGCDTVATFRVKLDFNLEPEALSDRLETITGDPNFEMKRVIGEQGVALYDFRVPHNKLFSEHKEGLLGALAQVEREVTRVIEQRKLLDMVVRS